MFLKPPSPQPSPRGEGVGCGPDTKVENNSGVLSPLRERDRVRGGFAKHQPDPKIVAVIFAPFLIFRLTIWTTAWGPLAERVAVRPLDRRKT
jgi:hypothetical protein